MKVRCVGIDPLQFPVDQATHYYFTRQFGRGAKPLYDKMQIGQTYTVHAIIFSSGYPYYYVPYRHRGHDCWRHVPSFCFEVIDDRLSKLWHIGVRASYGNAPSFPLVTTLAIKEWIDEPQFFERLVDCKERELRIFTEAAAAMDVEFD